MISKTVQTLLKQRPLYCAVVNKFAEPEASAYLTDVGCKSINGLPLSCFVMDPPHSLLPPSPQTAHKLLYYYTMDIASLFPVLALDPHPQSNVLDMCAAPGGKSFALVQLLSLQSSKLGGSLALNDCNQSRLKRLKEVIFSNCLPKVSRHSVRVTKRKAEEWRQIEENEYDHVLVDVPCSSDRHHICQWLEKGVVYPNTEEFTKLQERILLAALFSAKRGGNVVYSTCTLSNSENDNVIQRTLNEAHSLRLAVVPELCTSVYEPLTSLCRYNSTVYGTLVTPSEHFNCGPMYVCKLHLS